MIKLEKISIKQPELNLIAEWRDSSLQTLRTSDLTAPNKSQEDWINNLSISEKYYYIYNDTAFVGYCGLDKIHMSNRTAEISLLIGDKYQSRGIGNKTIKELLKLGFNVFNLNLIHGECYDTTENISFWLKCGFKIDGSLRDRKYWNNKYYNSIIFSMTKEEYNE